MKLRKIMWVKQKIVGLLMLLVSLIFLNLFVANDAAILLIITIPMGLYLLFSRNRFFDSDYIIEFNRNLL